jgi:hypothetical protein
MTEQRIPVALEGEGAPEGTRRPYQKPAIAEEESFETCATLGCALSSSATHCGGRYPGPLMKSA